MGARRMKFVAVSKTTKKVVEVSKRIDGITAENCNIYRVSLFNSIDVGDEWNDTVIPHLLSR